MKDNRTAGFTVITIIYIIALLIGVALFRAFTDLHVFWRVFIADAGATVFVYLTGVALKNASVYDPYWSVAPVVVFSGLSLGYYRMDFGVFLLVAAVWYWGVRLTLNWAHTFDNLNHQDWRYDGFKSRYPRAFQIISFFGINMFPTVVVFLCMLPGIVFIENSTVNMLTLLGFAICIGAATLELVADCQMHRFRAENEGGGIIRDGLWKHSRHPNYLGEILMWWGVYIIMLSARPGMWYLGIGALVNTLMFICISIPLAEKRNSSIREGYEKYLAETRALLPIRVRSGDDDEVCEEDE